tara:strand:- start:142 stop:564 length:423 start_codon:yes stop_codon:yes gene_type:complete
MKEIGQLYFNACGGNANALLFVSLFHTYCHAVDDLIDGDVERTPETLLEVLMQANQLYSTPFYLENAYRLQPVIALITNTYADSVAWEKDGTDWKRNIADVIRQCGNDMILAVACIVGGYKHMRSISLELREVAYHSQHS